MFIFRSLFASFVGGLLLYVFSIGPMTSLSRSGALDNFPRIRSGIPIIYRPIWKLAHCYPPLYEALSAYVFRWAPIRKGEPNTIPLQPPQTNSP